MAARKLRNHRRNQQWADLHYKKRLLGTAYKSSPFGVCTTPYIRDREWEVVEKANKRRYYTAFEI